MRLNIYLKAILVFFIIFQVKDCRTLGRMYESDSNNKYYIENEQKYKWVEALSTCLEMNMSLVTIDTASKSNEINRLVLKTFGKKVELWVGGLRNRYPSQHFTWIPTAKSFTNTYWEGKNPDNSGNAEYCVEIGWGNNMEWNDKSCDYELGFICEPNHHHLEKASWQKQLQQGAEKQQLLQAQVLEKDKREKILLQELESIKEALNQQKEKVKELMETNEKNLQQLNEMKNRKYHDIILHFHQDRYAANN
ncbi:hypothetical protein FF38_03342 [Lucilia cuprina]|uniref:C-type lectin domain-containing protein n=1 Tax=Lucilia cuprina TaxID=7375 RepID=A0A0L0C3Q1_LUCCU|nr:hypothetical protein FF38_03342 [Lucilia cuprina]